MPRPNRSEEKRAELLPVVAQCFVQRGYRRTTTAELARTCGVQETILYRLWPGKREMFLAAIEYVYQLSADTWRRVLAQPDDEGSDAERLLRYESRHLGEFGLYRVLFAGLSETDDSEIRAALGRTFRRFHDEIRSRIAEHHRERGQEAPLDPRQAAWTLIGLGMVSNLGRDVELFDETERQALLAEVGGLLLQGD